MPHILADRYRIERELGRGGMAIVYLAQDLKHRRDVAVKIVNPDVAAILAHDRFLREIDIAAHLNHPHVVALFDSGFEEGLLYYVMPCIPGESLRAMLDRQGTIPLEDALKLAREIASALAHAHENGIVHRDIKPENILINAGIAVVADFGIGRAMSAAAQDEASMLTETGLVMGTPHYMSPEQATGDAVDGRSDIYSLACVLFEMLTGKPPFSSATTPGLIAAHLTQPPPNASDIVSSVPRGVSDAISRALAKVPNDRPPSAIRFAESLSAAHIGGVMRLQVAAGIETPNNLPPERTRFIGREREIRECRGYLADSRLLTLTGIGGCGKTRLALAIGHDVLGEFTDGVWFVDLAPLTDETRIAAAAAASMGIPEAPGRNLVDVISEHVSDRKVLVVLDNCEHLIDATAAFADSILDRSRSARILATSREGLGVSGEKVVSVKSLAVPSAGTTRDLRTIEAAESVRLFTDRAKMALPGFAITEANAGTIAEICRRLDGIPLAIELAAARTKVLSVEQIRERLNDRFRLLTGSSRTVVARHQTLSATIQWSYDQLPAEEQRLFRLFSAFSGGWTLSSATALASPASDEFAVLLAIEHLANKSLVFVQHDESHASEPRYGMQETVRQYAHERLAEANEAPDTHCRHLEVFAAMAERAYEERNSREDYWTRRLEADHDNLRTALDTAREKSADEYLQLAGALAWFWQARSHLIEGRDNVTAALAQASAQGSERARALWGLGTMVGWQGDAAASLRYMHEALAIWREHGQLNEVALALEGIGWAQILADDYDAAESTLVECLRIQEGRQDLVMLNRARAALAQAWVCKSKVPEARHLSEQIISFSNAHGDLRNEHFGWHFLADCALLEGKCDESLPLYQKSLTLAQAMGDKLEMSFEIQGVGMSLAGLGDAKGGLRLVSAAKAEWLRIGVDLQLKFWNDLLNRYMGTAREAIAPADAERAWSEGAGTSFDNATATALSVSVPRSDVLLENR